MYFKDEQHKKEALQLMKGFGYEKLEDDREYGAFS
mgnify:CR=1 FL=1